MSEYRQNETWQPLQSTVDLSIIYATNGLALLLPPQVYHIDVATIMAGKPLGGDAALIPKARDDILNALHVGGTVRDIIVDPRKSVEDLLKSIFHW